jgi:hypothetical protein
MAQTHTAQVPAPNQKYGSNRFFNNIEPFEDKDKDEASIRTDNTPMFNEIDNLFE